MSAAATRRYWLTTHWPPRWGEERSVGSGLWLKDGHEERGAEVAPGDLVLVYQMRKGPTEVRREATGTRYVTRAPGRGGIVAVARVDGPFEDKFPDAEHYTNRKSIWWRWYAPTTVLSTSGFVDGYYVNTALGYKPMYLMRGFGRGSGLQRIEQAQFDELLAHFRGSNPPVLPRLPVVPGDGRAGVGESSAHRALKERVAADPAGLLGEAGLVCEEVEYCFPTGDRADVVLSDAAGRIVGLEVELDVGDNDWAGPLQAIKYRRMLEPLTRRNAGDSRSMLVAHSISRAMRERCEAYGIECFAVPR